MTMNTDTAPITPAIAWAMAKNRVFGSNLLECDYDSDYNISLTPAEDTAFFAMVGERGVVGPTDVYDVWRQLQVESGLDEFAIPSYWGADYVLDNVFESVTRAVKLTRRIVADPSAYFAGAKLMQRCLEQALVFPARHDQSTWFTLKFGVDGDGNITTCGSTGCLAGHAVILGSPSAPRLDPRDIREGASVRVDYVQDDLGHQVEPGDEAVGLLFLDGAEGDWMFDPHRTLDELWQYAEILFPGLVAYPDAARRAAIAEEGPLTRFDRIGLTTNGIVGLGELPEHLG